MGYQCSEMTAQYTGRPGVNLDTVYNAGIQPFNLADHHREGNSKVCLPFLLFPSKLILIKKTIETDHFLNHYQLQTQAKMALRLRAL